MSFRQGQPWEALWLLRLQRPVSWKSQKLFRSKKPILKLICLFQEAGLLLWFQDAREQIYCKISCQEMPSFSRYVRNDGTQNGPEKVSHARALIFALLACFADFCRSFGVESSSWLLQLLVSMGFTKYSTETFRVLPVQGGWCQQGCHGYLQCLTAFYAPGPFIFKVPDRKLIIILWWSVTYLCCSSSSLMREFSRSLECSSSVSFSLASCSFKVAVADSSYGRKIQTTKFNITHLYVEENV